MRYSCAVLLLLAICGSISGQTDRPDWLDNPAKFCSELAVRSRTPPGSLGKGDPPTLERYRVHPIAPPRKEEAVVGKYDASDKSKFAREVKEEVSKGPDFAGRYAVIEWSCGSWCANVAIADVLTGANKRPSVSGRGGVFRRYGRLRDDRAASGQLANDCTREPGDDRWTDRL